MPILAAGTVLSQLPLLMMGRLSCCFGFYMHAAQLGVCTSIPPSCTDAVVLLSYYSCPALCQCKCQHLWLAARWLHLHETLKTWHKAVHKLNVRLFESLCPLPELLLSEPVFEPVAPWPILNSELVLLSYVHRSRP